MPIAGDVTQPDDVERMVQSTIDRWGRLDVLITNAGGPAAGKFLDLKIEQWEAAVQVSLMSVVRLCYAALPHLLKNDPPQRGTIVAITSLSVKQPVENLLLSNSVRMAVIGLLKTLAGELGPQGIRVNAIAPGWTRTERVHGNHGKPRQSQRHHAGRRIEEAGRRHSLWARGRTRRIRRCAGVAGLAARLVCAWHRTPRGWWYD